MPRVLTRNILVKVLFAAGAAWVIGSAVGAATMGTAPRT